MRVFNEPLARNLADVPSGSPIENPKSKTNSKSWYFFFCRNRC